ncbi:efflux RND transporter periplasmic adaptor subunit [Alloalcanivorax xenomutans]|jgi:membrane fusion protein, heavy metal efflux system|uniref:Efflux RND transporter periplasmic adaptor subunit n=1 Tax=Alloalcanivorax xenomutans TaxID=1094342 RepID=A0A9Q3W4Z9_9GAMM|nr:efflux RND transporter periplasmic adaptor subunit [Alloalcanivorax xenomutans]ARB47382.1 hemolysin D [Alloalcanivorax xenomutans]MBA4723217.1 efflux RND transporter periplasmic adaptor subunit [Alcanivorax sp.]MCE7508178.1 efflux RND transporter periplasmic adaptor subunit [Alloalcanivorax xenomutans]CUR48079.1 Probable Co/Zn/Cd efflux system membrane fusion protein [Alloalcanivorax xenomutans]|tara:strand:+ start:116 stop:1285 length:1170 start_codon:yes stop_codon:yes gene_type:complete
MKNVITRKRVGLCLLLLAFSSVWADQGEGHDDGAGAAEHEHGQEESAGEANGHGDDLTLTEAQRRMLGLQVITLQPAASATRSLRLPAEITSNLYRTWEVPVRVDSQVLSRSATLGQHLEKGDPVATLFSAEMATLQAELRAVSDEWRRVRSLGRATVGNQRYLDVQGRYQDLKARGRGYGLADADLADIEKGKGDAGVYTLRAPDAGLVLSDAFQQGQWLAAGSPLITLVDEAELWAEAALPPQPGLRVDTGTPARVRVGETLVDGEVILSGHRLDPVTRTMEVRIRVPNENHLLHPGMFADVELVLPLSDNALVVPEEALTRGGDGDWQVFVEEKPGIYEAREVTPGQALEGARVVEGLPAGTRIVTRGAFFLASEQAKSGFDVHAH